MKILLDENIPHDLRAYLPNAHTAAYAGFAGLKNGKLLEAAEAAGFDVLVTGDKTLPYEQNLTGRKIALVCLSAVSWPVIEPFAGRIAAAVDRATPGALVRVECGAFSRKPGRGQTPSTG